MKVATVVSKYKSDLADERSKNVDLRSKYDAQVIVTGECAEGKRIALLDLQKEKDDCKASLTKCQDTDPNMPIP